MRGLRSFAVLSAALLLASCSTDLMSPNGKEGKTAVIVASPSAASCTTAPLNQEIVNDINALMAILTPNNSSAQSKWQQVLDAIAANDPVAAQSALDNLIEFINLKYGQANTQDVYVGGVPIADFKAQLFLDMQCYVDANLFDLNPGDPAKVFVDQVTSAGVYFPQGFVPQGFNVVIETPASNSNPLPTLLDQHPSFINIKLVDANGNEPDYDSPDWAGFNGEAFVAVCFPGNLPSDVYPRLRLGHDSPISGFEILEKRAVPQALADALSCGGDPGFDIQTTAFGRVIRSVADFLLPERLNAAFFAFGGVGGSPEEFSPFGAVDPGLNFGGAGGAPEEFAPGVLPSTSASRPQTSTLSADGETVTGKADEDDNSALAYALPRVRVATPAGSGIEGIEVSFVLSPPVGAGLTDSDATLCNGATAMTDSDGWAEVPCINFGTKPGFKNLKATFNPSDVDPSACILDGAVCTATDGGRNFLVVTEEGDAAYLSVVSGPSGGQVGEGLDQIVLKVTDGSAALNPIQGAVVTISHTLADGGTLGCTVADCLDPRTTGPDGQVTFENLKITGLVAGKPQTLTFSSGNLSAEVTVTLNPGAPAVLEVSPAAASAVAEYPNGGDVTDLVATVKDAFGNKVPAVQVSVSPPAGYTLGGTTDVQTVATPTDTVASFLDLKLGGTAGSVSLTFESGTLTDVLVTVDLSPGPAATLAVSPASTSATALHPDGGDLGDDLTATVTDGWGNRIEGAEVSVTAPAGYSLTGTTTGVGTSGVDRTAVFADLKLGGSPAPASPQLTFSSDGVANAIVTVALTAGPVGNLSVTPTSTTASLGATIPTLTATVKDGWSNNLISVPVSVSSPVGTTLTGTLSRNTSSTGIAQFGNLAITASNVETVPLTFVAGTRSQVVNVGLNVTVAACVASGTQKKTDLASYSASLAGHLGYFSIPSAVTGTLRSVRVNMSVTGQSSGSGDYPAELRAYQLVAGKKGDLIARFRPATTDRTLKLPGSNSKPYEVVFTLDPASTGQVTAPNGMLFELQIQSVAQRTFQLWYNTKPAGTCLGSKLFNRGTVANSTTFNFGAATGFISGLHLNVRNF